MRIASPRISEFAALISAVLLVACEEPTPVAGPSVPDPDTGTVQKASGPTGRWPYITDADVAADNPLATNVYVILDASGSMSEQRCAPSGSKMHEAKQALRAFSETIPVDTQLGLMVFTDNQVREDVPLGAGNRGRFVQASMNIQPGGGTPLKTAIELAYRRLTDQGRAQLGYGEYHLVVVTDGEASKGEDPTAVVNRLLADSPVVLHTIGFCIGTDHSLNQPGRTLYRTADNAAALTAGLQSVLAEAPSFTVTSFQ